MRVQIYTQRSSAAIKMASNPVNQRHGCRRPDQVLETWQIPEVQVNDGTGTEHRGQQGKSMNIHSVEGF